VKKERKKDMMMNTQDDPAFRARLEAMSAQSEKEIGSDPGVQSAQWALDQARGTLEQVETRVHSTPLYQRGRYLDQLSAAKQAVSDAETALRSAENTAARNRWQGQLQAQRDAQQKERDQVQQQYAAQEEAQAKEQLKASWLVAGGTEAGFTKAWPDLWQKEVERRTLARQAAQDAVRLPARDAF
jgi:hypothetical protein